MLQRNALKFFAEFHTELAAAPGCRILGSRRTHLTQEDYAMTRTIALSLAALASAMTLQAAPASAVSIAVKMACMTDYLANCSQHAIGTPAVRSCMRAVGPRLSKRCVNALIAGGEVTQAEVDRRKSSMKSAAN